MITDQDMRDFAGFLVAWCLRDIEAGSVLKGSTGSALAVVPPATIPTAGCAVTRTAPMTKWRNRPRTRPAAAPSGPEEGTC